MKLKHINLMNVFMCFGVVTIHLTSIPVLNLRRDSLWYLLFFVINKFFSFAVPTFLFLSGFKLFHKSRNAKIDLKSFYIGRIRRLVIPYLIAFAVYFTFFKTQNLATWDELLPGLFLGKLVAHFYYIIIAIQFYLLFPLLKFLFDRADKLLLILSFVSTILLNQFVSFAYDDRFFATYIFYFVLGMFLAKYRAEKPIRPVWLYAAAFLTAAGVHIALCYRMSLGGFWYRNSGIGQVLYVTTAILLLYICSMKTDCKKVEAIVEFFDPHTLNIFLYHILIMNIMQFVVLPHYDLSIKFQFLIISAVVFTVIFLYCLLMNFLKTRGARRLENR